MVRGGVLAVSSEEQDGEAEVRVQLYAELINANSSRIQSFRARGIGRQSAAGFDLDGLLASADWRSSSFRRTALGKALSNAIEQLSESVHEAIASPADDQVAEVHTDTDAEPSEADVAEDEETVGDEDLTADEDADIGDKEESIDEEEAEYVAQNDEDLQQLIAQAQVLLDEGWSLSSEDLDTLSETLERLQTALDSKASRLQSGEDAAEAELEIAEVSEELRSLLSSLSEEETYAEADPESYEEPSEERRGLLKGLNDILGQTNNAIQQIQEIHSAFAGTPGYADDSADYPPDSEEFPADEEYSEPAEAFGESESEEGWEEEEGAPYEEPLEEVSGVITESGEPVEGVTVIDSETGASATTDSEGYYTLKGIPGGRVAKLMMADQGKKVAVGNVNLARGGAGIADFELQRRAAAPARSKIIPYAVPVKAGMSNRANTGMVRGVVRSAKGKPVPRALVQLEGLGVARTDSKGQYVFKNVPAGIHQLKVRKGSSLLQSQQVKVEPRKASISQTQLATGTVPKRMGQSLVVRGTGTILRGVVSDGRRPIGKAKVTLVQPSGALSSATRSNGKYAFRDLKPGSYRVLVSRAGYERLTSVVALRSGQTQVHDLQLKKSKILPAVARAKTPTRVTGARAVPKVAKVTEPKRAKATGTVPKVTKTTTATRPTTTRAVPKVAKTAAKPIAPGEVRGQVRGPNRKGLSNARVELTVIQPRIIPKK